MDPRKASTMPTTNYGMVGIGNFSSSGPNTGTNQVDAKLDIDGDLRIRTVTRKDSLTRVLVIDSTDHNRVHYAEIDLNSNYGNCTDSVIGVLTENSKIDLNNHTFYFVGNDPTNTQNNVGFGWSCGDSLKAKVDAIQMGRGGIADRFQTFENFIWGYNNYTPSGIEALAAGDGNNQASFYGIQSFAYGSNSVANYGIYATTGFNGTVDYAGYFQGDVYTTGAYLPSDSTLKENIQEIEDAGVILEQLNPVTFDFKTSVFPQLHLDGENQMGLIAQEVESILPALISQVVSPAELDSAGNVVNPSVSFKSVDYTKLIPLLVAGHKEQSSTIDSLQTANEDLQEQVTDLNDRLTHLENCLSGILPFLCQMNHSVVQQTPSEIQNELARVINVNLSDRNNIILNQNVPNPFAESTTITYSVPATVQKAQIHFYDGQGKLINSVDINERGNGQLNVFANDLSTGVYTYSLVADGQIIKTLRMVKQ